MCHRVPLLFEERRFTGTRWARSRGATGLGWGWRRWAEVELGASGTGAKSTKFNGGATSCSGR